MFDDSTPQFHTQRRNLIFISSLILLYEIAGLSVNGEAHLPIVNVTIEKPETINAFLHGIAIYFFWRYFISFEQTGGFSFRKQEIMKSIGENIWKDTYSKLKLELAHKPDCSTVHGITLESEDFKHPQIRDLFKKSLTCKYSYKNKALETIHQTKEIPCYRILLVASSTMLHSMIRTNFFVEYFFPFFLFALCILESLDIHLLGGIVGFLNW